MQAMLPQLLSSCVWHTVLVTLPVSSSTVASSMPALTSCIHCLQSSSLWRSCVDEGKAAQLEALVGLCSLAELKSQSKETGGKKQLIESTGSRTRKKEMRSMDRGETSDWFWREIQSLAC